MKLGGMIILLSVFATHAHSQQSDNAEPKLIHAPIAEKPREARKTGLGGTLSVLVNIDENGVVRSATDATGADWVCPGVIQPDVLALREAAINAALTVKFEPIVVDGKAVPYTTRVNLNFPAEKKKSEVSTINHRLPSDILDKEANSVPLPTFPPAARAVKASGPVNVQVLIEVDGTVFSAESVSGHPLLKPAARTAACNAKFKPTLISGKPVRVTGSLVYNFIPN